MRSAPTSSGPPPSSISAQHPAVLTAEHVANAHAGTSVAPLYVARYAPSTAIAAKSFNTLAAAAPETPKRRVIGTPTTMAERVDATQPRNTKWGCSKERKAELSSPNTPVVTGRSVTQKIINAGRSR